MKEKTLKDGHTTASSPSSSPNETHYDPEQFKRATIGVVHALSGRQDMDINFYSGTTRQNATFSTAVSKQVYLPQPPQQIEKKALSQLRGVADAAALRLKYHDIRLHEQFQPDPGDARTSFDALEQVRVEALGSRYMKGVAANLHSIVEQASKDEGHAHMTKAEQMPASVALSLLVREKLTGEPPPRDSRKILNLWRDRLDKTGKEALNHMAEHLEDQAAFAKDSRQLLAAYHLIEEDVPAESEENEDNQTGEQPDSDEPSNEEETTQETPQEQDSTVQLAQSHERTEELDVNQGQGFEAQDQPAGPKEEKQPLSDSLEDDSYHIYTKQYDEIVSANDLCDPEELDYLRQQLDQQLLYVQNVVSRLANRLQRKLMAQQTRGWNFNQEEGLLDASRLTRVITNPGQPLSYKQEKEMEFRDTVVTLLIDNSGSMRGKPISIAAMCGDILARTLERCSVKVEILGFTTRAWKGGHSREKWLSDGKPNDPGRLNDLRHIIYKSADQPWRHSRRNLGLMLQEGLLKENIDGEALYWAWQRLRFRPERRKILMVISDGAPVDDSTLSANNPEYLEQHLRRMIMQIEAQKNIELTAIGIGHDVTRYYRRAVTITDSEQLGGTMIKELATLFDTDRRLVTN